MKMLRANRGGGGGGWVELGFNADAAKKLLGIEVSADWGLKI